MRGRAGMAVLAGHSGPQSFKRHFSVRNRVAGVATETDFGFGHADFAANCLFQTARLQVLIPSGEIEARNRGIITHSTLVTASLVLQNPSLRPGAEIPMNGNGNRARSVAHAVGALRSTGFDGIRVCAFANRQLRNFS